MRASLICIGTELTDGQIVNRNASTLSHKLKELGLRVSIHLTVPDDKKLILEALQLAYKQSDFLFVTGGLGPTSDDFTREVLAEWTDSPLEFHSPSWEHVQHRLSSRGFPIHDFQKQQCYYPKDAHVLMNNEGTANGFRFEFQNKNLIVLPGPPREIDSIWKHHLQDWLKKLCSSIDKPVTHSWDTLGYGESQIVALVEPLVKNQNIEVGYRVHLPYVEFKVTYPKSKASTYQSLIDQIDRVLEPVTFLKNGEDAAELLANKLQTKSFTLTDQGSGGFLENRLLSKLFKQTDFRWETTTIGASDLADLTSSRTHLGSNNKTNTKTYDIKLKFDLLDSETADVYFVSNHQITKQRFETPIKSILLAERKKQYLTEMALIFWLKQLT